MALREPDIVEDQLAHDVIGAAIEVHRVLGPGYLESVYQEALQIELGLQEIPFVAQSAITVDYKGNRVGEGKPDFLVGGVLVVELKTVEDFLPIHYAQVISYLKMTENVLGLLINFNKTILRHGVKRVVRTE